MKSNCILLASSLVVLTSTVKYGSYGIHIPLLSEILSVYTLTCSLGTIPPAQSSV